ncbi:MAG: hypothetical protein D3913_06715 [Candidatus Electrothrix sp. LOE1_4_5]|nr:hypothetical protein [Candidatus Electrothrix gigas]
MRKSIVDSITTSLSNVIKFLMILERKYKHSLASFFISSARFLLRAILFLLLCSNPLAAQNAPETVTIKLPYNGPDMRFKAVYLGIKDKSFPSHFASRKFMLGSRDPSKQTYKQQQVMLELAGSFIGRRNGKPDWLYYLGETEVSQGQWNSIMRWMDEQEGKNSAAKELDDSQAQLPKNKITVAQVYRFIEALNTWMLQQQKDKLPKNGQSYAFARLPTEAEWAFAARGGIDVLENDPDRFNRSYPYTQELRKYEWHSQNSGGKPRKCGSNEFPNPIGLRDMLGNVEELTASLFSPLYAHGRLGQFVIRGNSFRDSPKYFDVSCRTEFASHSSEGKLILSDRLGFRLALSSAISGSGGRNVLNKGYKLYVDSLESKEPSLVGETPATQAEKNSREYSKIETNKFKADRERQESEIFRLQRLRNKDQAEIFRLQRLHNKDQAKQSIQSEAIKKETVFSLDIEPVGLKELHDADGLIINKENIKKFSVDVDQKTLAIQYFNSSSSVLRQGLNSISYTLGKIRKKILLWREQKKLEQFHQPYKISHAILIAIDNYSRKNDIQGRRRTGFNDLGMMVESAEILKKELIKYGFPEKNIHTFYNKNATSKNIEKSIKLFYKGGKFGSVDRLFFYFGGHGFANEEKNGYLVTYDFDRKKPDLTSISMEDFISTYARKINTHHMLIALDACYAGLSYKVQDKLSNEQELRTFRSLSIIRSDTTKKARNILLAGTKNQKALWEHGGIFTKALISGIRGEADYNKDRIIQFRELALYIRNKVIPETSRRGFKQEPESYILDRFGEGRFIFITPSN